MFRFCFSAFPRPISYVLNTYQNQSERICNLLPIVICLKVLMYYIGLLMTFISQTVKFAWVCFFKVTTALMFICVTLYPAVLDVYVCYIVPRCACCLCVLQCTPLCLMFMCVTLYPAVLDVYMCYIVPRCAWWSFLSTHNAFYMYSWLYFGNKLRFFPVSHSWKEVSVNQQRNVNTIFSCVVGLFKSSHTKLTLVFAYTETFSIVS